MDVDEVAVSCLSCRTVADRRDLPKFSWCSVTLRALAFSVCTTSDILLALENPTNVSEWTTNTYAAAGFNSVIWKQRIMMMTNDKFYCFFYLNKTIQTLFLNYCILTVNNTTDIWTIIIKNEYDGICINNKSNCYWLVVQVFSSLQIQLPIY